MISTCSACNESKPLEAFYKHEGHRNGVASWCKPCAKKKAKDRYSFKVVRSKNLQDKFGISADEYELLLAAQGDVCAICGQKETAKWKGRTRYLAVDHDHSTGRVRGLLCAACNTGIGQLGDSIERLENAIAYLKGAR